MPSSSSSSQTKGQSIWSRFLAILTSIGLVAAILLSTPPVGAQAAADSDSPAVGLTASVASSTLFGRDIEVALEASEATGADAYNLSFNSTVPAYVTYVPGSTQLDGQTAAEPKAMLQADGSSVLVWTNVSDLLTGTSASLAFQLRADTSVFQVGDSVALHAGAFVNADARTVPDFDAASGASVGDVTAFGSASATTTLSPFDLNKNEPSAEAELLRGLQNHQTIFTLDLQNNLVNSTTGFSIIDHIPAGLEFLGCGDVDHSSTLEEYPGAGAINPGNAPAMSNPCLNAASVTTVSIDPDGSGPMPEGVYTRVEWDAASLTTQFDSADLAPGGSLSIDYIAAIPLRRNVLAPLTDPTANLDNNTGSLTSDEEAIVGHARAYGDYAGTLPSSDDATEAVTAEDVSVHLSPSAASFRHDSSTTWTTVIETSEYALRTGPVVITQTLPDGLDVTASNPTVGAGFPLTNADGSSILQWTLNGFEAPSSTATISLDTETRSVYRATGTPVAALDTWSSTTASAAAAVIITDNDGSVTELSAPDASSGSQQSAGVSITKEIAEVGSLTCGDSSGLRFTADFAGPFGPGDRVCWRLTVELPSDLDVLSLVVEDHLPDGFEYQHHAPTASNDVAVVDSFTASGDVLQWSLGDVDASAQRFQVIIETIIVDARAADPADLTGNLMKARHVNTSGNVFQLRDEAHAEWGAPLLELTSGVLDLNDLPVQAAPADNVQVEAGDVIGSGVAVTNTGNIGATNVSVRHNLASNTNCVDVSAISDAGLCTLNGGWIQWDGLEVAAGETLTLTHDMSIPTGITAAVTMQSISGVRTYDATTNTGTNFSYVPESNIDTTLSPNTSRADDTWSIHTARPVISMSRTTAIDEAGNTAGNQATIGETISYTVDVVLPQGTTFYGPAQISDDLGERLDLDESSFVATLDGGLLPQDWGVTNNGNKILVSFSDSYIVPLGADQTVRLEFDATVNNVASNTRTDRIRNQILLSWENEEGSPSREAKSINTHVVEPVLSLAKSHDDADAVIEPSQTYRYTLTVNNGTANKTAVAHDIVIVDVVAPELTVLEGPADPAEDGDAVGPDSGVWDANTRTMTWTVSPLDPGTTASVRYDVQASTPLTATASLSSEGVTTASSMAGIRDGERSADSSVQSAGYRAIATDSANGPSLAVTTSMSVAIATIGESVDVSIVVTVPANTIGYDVTVIDDLPVGLTYESLLSVTCANAGGLCTPDVTAVPAQSSGADAAFFLGDLVQPSTADRTVTISYRAFVEDVAAANALVALTNSAVVHFNRTDQNVDPNEASVTAASFDANTDPSSASVTLAEPLIGVDKNVLGQDGDADARRATPGTTLTYSVVVTNSSAPGAGSAYDITVNDSPDQRLLELVDLTEVDGVTLIDGDQSDGALTWSITGPIAPGESVTISYDLTVPDRLDWDDEILSGPEVSNTADVSSYFGVDVARRATHPNRTFRRYEDVVNDTVEIELDLASISGAVWHDADGDSLRDADESGIEGVGLNVTYHGGAGTGDDELTNTVTGANGAWAVPELPGGTYTVEIDQATIPAGMTFTYDTAHGAVDPDGTWHGSVRGDKNVVRIDAGLGTPSELTAMDDEGNVWVAGLTPDGTAQVRMRTDDGVWSSWMQQGSTASWASISVNTDHAGNVWIVGVKLSGQAYVRTKTAGTPINQGWSSWYRQGSGGWASMSLSIDPSGNVWAVGVKTNGLGYSRVKNAGTAVNQGWSSWVRLGSTRWSGISVATDTNGGLWLAGVTTTGKGYVLTRSAGGDMVSNWSKWVRQGSGSDWESLNLAIDSRNNVWVNGVKEGGTAYARMKQPHASAYRGWSAWLQLGASNSWASMSITVDNTDSLWVAGVKHSGTAYVRVKCFCYSVTNGWSAWWQQGSVNIWESMTVTNDPANRVLLSGLKLDGTALTRTKNTESGINHGWSFWHQHGRSYTWDSFTPHSNGWTGSHPPRTPSLETQDTSWFAPVNWNASTHVPRGGSLTYC